MSLLNTKRTFGWVARALHWIVAVATIGLFLLAIWYRSLDYGHPWYTAAPELHISIGFALILVILFRLIWLLFNVKPEHLGHNAVINRMAGLMHWALHLLLIALVITGYLYATADGRSASVFGVIEIPALPGAKSLKGTIGWLHEYLSYGIIIFASVHGFAALKHHFVDRDDTLRRMVSGGRTPLTEHDQQETTQ